MAKTAILYARVSTDEQAEAGYSLAQQLDALREYAEEHGLIVLDEIRDPGVSGATLERPGLNRIRDLVAEGGVDMVLAQDQDRISREPWQYDYLKSVFEGYGTKLRALDDNDDESPTDEFVSYVRRGVAKLERAEFARRSRRNLLQKAREGKVIGNNKPNYGFEYNENRDGYVVNETTMSVMRRIFEEAANGGSIHGVVRGLNCEGVEPPGGGTGKWGITFVIKALQDEVYRPHSVDELRALGLRTDVAARLDPGQSYGVWYYNRQQVKKIKTIAPDGNGGERQKTRNQKTDLPRSEWIHRLAFYEDT